MMIAEYTLNIFDCHNIDFGSRNFDFGNQKQKYVKKLLSGLPPIQCWEAMTRTLSIRDKVLSSKPKKSNFISAAL